MTIADKIAEKIFRTIEFERRLIKDDIKAAVHRVLVDYGIDDFEPPEFEEEDDYDDLGCVDEYTLKIMKKTAVAYKRSLRPDESTLLDLIRQRARRA